MNNRAVQTIGEALYKLRIAFESVGVPPPDVIGYTNQKDGLKARERFLAENDSNILPHPRAAYVDDKLAGMEIRWTTNDKLIDSAQDLYAALVAILPDCEDWVGFCEGHDHVEQANDMPDRILKARAALAKARGETA